MDSVFSPEKLRIFMKIKISGILLLTIILVGCGDFTNDQLGEDPVIEDIQLNYMTAEQSLFVSARANDPQGYQDVTRIQYSLYYTDSSDSETRLEQGNLYDDGTHGDIIPDNSEFTNTFQNMPEGIYKVVAEAFDIDENSSGPVEDTLRAMANEAPEIYIYDAPDEFEKGDRVKFEIKVTDPDGLSDIQYVEVTIQQPDGEMIDNSWLLRDDGNYGDQRAGDGIYSIEFPTNQASKLHGFWHFYFIAVDKNNHVSNKLDQKLKNPGLAVIYPDSTTSFEQGETITVQWDQAFVDTVVVEFTANANAQDPTFVPVTEQPGKTTEFQWTLPDDVTSEYCKIYIYDKHRPSRHDFSDEYFEVK